MIFYCDTSALIKLLVTELHSKAIQKLCAESTRMLISQLTWAEMCAGLGLKQRTRQVDIQAAATALEQLQVNWPRYSKLGIDEERSIGQQFAFLLLRPAVGFSCDCAWH